MVLFGRFCVVVYSHRNRFSRRCPLPSEHDWAGQGRGANLAPTKGIQGLEFSSLKRRDVLAASDHVEGLL